MTVNIFKLRNPVGYLQKTYKNIENQLNELTNMKPKRQITDEEFDIKRDELLKDKSKTKDNIDGYDHRMD